MYKEALKQGYFYTTTRGPASTQDLFAMPLRGNNGFNLNSVAQNIAKSIKESEEESFVDSTPTTTTDTKRLDIVKDIIKDKLVAEAAKKTAASNKIRKDKILAILASKQDAAMENKTETELLAELEALS